MNLTPHLGDLVMMLPLLELLRAAQPEARLECVVERSSAEVLAMAPVDAMHVFTLPGAPPVLFVPAVRRVMAIVREYLRVMPQRAPDICISVRWGDDLFRSNALAYLSGAPRRIGYSSAVAPGKRRPQWRDAMLTELLEGGHGLHESERFVRLATQTELAPANSRAEHDVSPSLRALAATVDLPALLERYGIADPYVVLAPGASHLKRQWPAERWAAVAKALAAKGFAVVVLSGNADRATASTVHAAAAETLLVAGRTTLRESAALLGGAKLFVGGDSGPGHIAGGLGTPAVTLYIAMPNRATDGVSSPERIHPLGPYRASCYPARIVPPCVDLCMADGPHCIGQISVDEVLLQAAGLLEDAASRCESSIR